MAMRDQKKQETRAEGKIGERRCGSILKAKKNEEICIRRKFEILEEFMMFMGKISVIKKI